MGLDEDIAAKLKISAMLERTRHRHDKRNFAKLEHMLFRYKRGDTDALLEALRLCLTFDMQPPPWIAVSVSNAISRFLLYGAVTLDEAFRVKRSKDPRTIATERRNFILVGRVTEYIRAEQTKGASLNEEFFIETGERFGISKNRVIKLWNRGRGVWGRTPKRTTKKRS